MQNWILYTLIYAIFTGFFQCAKKKAVEKNSIYEVLAIFSTIAFLLASLTSKNVFDIGFIPLIIVFSKSLVIVIAWILSLHAIQKMPISLYSVINLSRIVFSIIMSLIFLGEKLTTLLIIGAMIIILGLFLVNKVSNVKSKKETSLKVILILLVSCLLNAISAIIDKQVLKYINPTQLQFWFLLFLAICYWSILLFKHKKLDFKKIKKNYWILIAAICLTVADRFLFKANEFPESKVSIMTLIKQVSVIEGIILGKILFDEKNIIKKLLCSLLIIIGIILIVM
jgi:drug/metabolite transporter (DMT)-like permease